MMAMNWPKNVVGYYLEYTFFLHLVVLSTTFNIYKLENYLHRQLLNGLAVKRMTESETGRYLCEIQWLYVVYLCVLVTKQRVPDNGERLAYYGQGSFLKALRPALGPALSPV